MTLPWLCCTACFAPRTALPAGPYDPNDPHGPPQPPSAWQAMLHAVSGVVHFFGRLSFLVDENAHAVHFFISALLQLLDRCGAPDAAGHEQPRRVRAGAVPGVCLEEVLPSRFKLTGPALRV